MRTPDGWRETTVDDVVESVRAGFSAHGEERQIEVGEVGVLKTGAVLSGQFDRTKHKVVPSSLVSRLRVPVAAGTIILGRKNSEESVGASAYVEHDHGLLFLSDLLWEIRAKSSVDIRWLAFALQNDDVRERIRLSATGTQSTMKNISRNRLLELPLLAPPLPEQRRIAAILRAWDLAIERAESVRRLKLIRRNELRTSIFDPRSGLAAGWEMCTLRSISKRVIAKTDGAPHPVMTISAKSGFVSQASKYSRDMAGASLANYTLLQKGDFAYNKGNSLTYPQGCIFPLQEETALVPNVYFSFRLEDELNASFFAHHFAAGALNRQLAQRISSSVRGNGLLNLNPSDFFDVRVPVPDRTAQDAVAILLDAASEEIGLLTRQIELLRLQKRGLMQKLLTGKVRVATDDGNTDD